MKLSEVIKAIEDGSNNDFVNTIDGITVNNSVFEGRIKFWFECSEKALYIDGWEEVKPPRQWSEKELMLFKLLPDWAKWITINTVGNVFVFDSKPNKIKNGEMSGFENFTGKYIRLEFDFLTITFEESPIYIGDLKGE